MSIRFKLFLNGLLDRLGLGFMLSVRTKARRTTSVSSFIEHNKSCVPSSISLSIDLGCGSAPKNYFNAVKAIGFDIVHSEHPEIRTANLIGCELPLASNSVDIVYAFDFLEHVPRHVVSAEDAAPFILLMNEVYRILKIGGLFLSSTPSYPYSEAFQDPTHVNILTEKTIPLYFCSVMQNNWHPWAKQYGFDGKFELIDQAWCSHSLLHLLKK